MLNSTWTGQAEAYDAVRKCWLNDRRSNYIADHLRRITSSRRVVELGCGTGWLILRLAPLFPELEWLGIDPDGSYIRYAAGSAASQGIRTAKFIEGSGEQLRTCLSKPVDVILSNDVLHHLGSEEDTVAAAAESLVEGGHWLAVEPNCFNPYVAFRQATRPGERNFRPGRFQKLAEASGFQLVKREYLFLLPPFVRHPPQWLQALEAKWEGGALTSGGVALLLRKTRSG